MATEIREGDLVTYSATHIRKMAELHEDLVARGVRTGPNNITEDAIGIVEKVTVTQRVSEAVRNGTRGTRRGGTATYTRTAYRVVWERPNGGTWTDNGNRRGEIKPAK